MSPSILILTGPPGVGKTTLARLLAERAPKAVHLESDGFFTAIRSGYVEPWRPESHPQNEVVMGAVAAAARRYAGGGYFTVVDGVVLPRWFLEPLRDAFRESRLDVGYAVLAAPLETCLARCRDRRDAPPVDSEVVENLWCQFSDLGELERHVVDVDGRTAAEVSQVIAERLGDGSLEL